MLTLQQFVSENSWNPSISSHIHCIPQAVEDLLLLVLEVKKGEIFLCFIKLPIILTITMIIAFHRTHTIYVVLQSCGISSWMPGKFQAFTAILNWLTHLASISCWYRSDARQDEFWKFQVTLSWISKVQGYHLDCSRWSAKKHVQIPVIKQQNTSNAYFLISDHY